MNLEVNEILTDQWHLNKLLEAIGNVTERYIKIEYLEFHSDDEDAEPLAERVFAYELYRQWANLLESYSTGLIVNGEPKKDFIGEVIKFYNSYIKSKKKNYDIASFYPDLVLHSETTSSSDNNLIVCEIKRHKNIGGAINDLIKLNLFLLEEPIPQNEQLQWKAYKYGVFIIIGNDVDAMLGDLKDNLEKKKIEELKSNMIYCVVYNGYKNSLKCVKLADLLMTKSL